MAAYAALVSLIHIIDDIERHHSPPISLNKQQVQSLTENVTFLQEFLEAYISPVSDGDEADPLEMRIADAAYAAEHAIESHIVAKIQLSRSKETICSHFFSCFRGAEDPKTVSPNHDDDEEMNLYQDVQNVIQEMDQIKSLAMQRNTEKVVLHDKRRSFVSAPSSTGKNSSGTVVWSEGVVNGILERLVADQHERQVIPITGMGGIEPSSDDVVIMENLQVLERVRNFKCSEEVVKRIPNIKKLGMQYLGSEGIEHDDYYCLSNIERLCKLESLYISCWYDFRVSLYVLAFPQSLKKLTLSMNGGFEWEKMLEKIGALPHLEKFKLWEGCFKTGKWQMVEDQFPSLKYLGLYSCPSLEHWTAEASSIFPRLEKLQLFHMEELKEIPSQIGDIPTLQKIWMTDCGESSVRCAKEIVDQQVDLQGEVQFHVQVWFPRKDEEMQTFEALQSLAGPNFEVV
ncbi:uncharacterized protein LOC130989908 [Salvia miltiorrhiza]|uniref:uncharacterized protein LOC130989908 n=1 Tax=Salvia miltiorrhiza TaxID=226208 RepID=UPI0025AC0FC2|nr:uncharacterized protein LOC130989908 [Salvia miltiorrhiza]